MPTNELFDSLSHIHPISEAFKQALMEEVTALSLPRSHYLLEAPHVSDFIFFIKSGYATTFTYFQGRKYVECFWPAGSMVISMKSFLDQTPSEEFIQLEMDSEVLYLHRSRALSLANHFPEAAEIGRVLMSQRYEYTCGRIHDLLHLNAVSRYQKLRKRYARIEQAVSHQSIASYLGITPQSLNRIKRSYISE
jgi:CRP/FNR family transcriptional regulator, anaerobic regulatory protein